MPNRASPPAQKRYSGQVISHEHAHDKRLGGRATSTIPRIVRLGKNHMLLKGRGAGTASASTFIGIECLDGARLLSEQSAPIAQDGQLSGTADTLRSSPQFDRRFSNLHANSGPAR